MPPTSPHKGPHLTSPLRGEELVAAPSLRRGINLSSWYANAPRQPLTARDFAQLHQAGFDHVRLPVNPDLLGFSLNGEPQHLGDFTPIDSAIKQANAHHLAVILDLHPRADFMRTLEESQEARTQFTTLWVMLAQRYQPNRVLAFELLNEPQFYDHETDYQHFAEDLVKAIRTVDPQRLIIVAAPRGSSIEGLQQLSPIADKNIAYDVHFYEPYIVTHQGINQGFTKKMLRYFHDVPYPAALADADATRYAETTTETTTDTAQAKHELDTYRQENWNKERINARIKLMGDWADKNRARLICGEFGVFRPHIDTASRYRWIADVRQALEQQKIGWDLWDYTDMFGITTLSGDTITDPNDGAIRLSDPKRGSRNLEAEALTALGHKH